jgi:hypothetical protein
MILVRLQGGLGNQMFQYALGRKLALKNQTQLKLDLSLLHDRTPSKQAVFRDFDLDIFDIDFHLATQEEILYFNGKRGKNVIQKAQNVLKNKLLPKKLVIEKGRQFHPEVLNTKDNKCLAGSWQSYLYFEDIKDTLKKEFVIKESFLCDTFFEYKKQIETTEVAVSLHVRRGDYVTNEFYNDILGVLNVDYYEKALLKLNLNKSETKVFVFSDDIDWCKKNLGFNFETIFVEQDKSKNGVASDLALMMLCKHNIISNSSFAWWGAWLGMAKDKKVIAPINWVNKKYKGDFKIDSPDIVPPNWLRVE